MNKRLGDFVQGIPGLSVWSHADKIKFFAWYIHSTIGRDRFNQSDIRTCYDELHLDKPSNVSPYLQALEKTKPKQVLHDSRGYYLEKRVRDQLENKYGQRPSAIQVDKILQSLPDKVPDLVERTFLNEALLCFRCGAFRAAIVMTWNLAYDHLCNYVLNCHNTAFNTQLPKSFPKADISSIGKRDDFADLKESQVLQVCKSAGIISNDVHKIMKEKLDRRNTAAHPSSIVITQLQAEDYVSDLVNNVVVKLV